jgi:hypothetical protein
MKLAILAVMVTVGLALEGWQASLDQEWLLNCRGVEISLLDAIGIRHDATRRDFTNADC